MSVYKIFASADATMYSAHIGMNTGLDEILEVGCKNGQLPYSVINSADDIRRALVVFDNADLQEAYNLASGSVWDSYLRLYLANAENITDTYAVEVYSVSQSWNMGTGKYMDNPETQNGVCWNSTGPYVQGSSTDWSPATYYNTPGGGSWSTLVSSQSFGYNQDKDLNVSVKEIVSDWLVTGSQNNGFIVKLPSVVERGPYTYMSLEYFSVDTHTIYPPTLEFRWDDSSYNTGSLSTVSNSSFVVTLGNNPSTFKNDTSKYIFRVNVRDQFPTRAFVTSSIYTVNKALPQTSYWAIQDVKTEEMVVDFDQNYTKISCDSVGSYFQVYMNGLEPERYYKVLIRVALPTGESIDIDNNNTFKITR